MKQSNSNLLSLREWDYILLDRYPPFYNKRIGTCSFCAFGECDLKGSNRGACGIDDITHQARTVLLTVIIGASGHISHARKLVSGVVAEYGCDHLLDLGKESFIDTPVIQIVCGYKPRKIGDLEDVLAYLEREISHLMSVINFGQEIAVRDYESKSLHAGMLDSVALEVAEVAQISAYDFPKGEAKAPFVSLGTDTINKSKKVILIIGHNSSVSVRIMDYVDTHNLTDKIEVCGLCCAAAEGARHGQNVKIVGNQAEQLSFLKSGIADVIVLDNQCIRVDLLIEASKRGTRVILTDEIISAGLTNRVKEQSDSIIDGLVTGKFNAVFIPDTKKSAHISVKTALGLSDRKTEKVEDILKTAQNCTNCNKCTLICPVNLPVSKSIKEIGENSLENIQDLLDKCVGCGKCSYSCPELIDVYKVLIHSNCHVKEKRENYRIRAGRGMVRGGEIKNIAPPVIMGEIPGIVGFAGCPGYSNGYKEIQSAVGELISKKYIITSCGCVSFDIARSKNDAGVSFFENANGNFDAGCITNLGSCVSGTHLMGAAIKIASIMLHRPLDGMYKEIADYILNRIGVVLVIWGGFTQKAFATATGANRLGIPVIFGPRGGNYSRQLLSSTEEVKNRTVHDARLGEEVSTGPAPEHLFYSAKDYEDLLVMTVKLCLRPNDTTGGRKKKLTNYIDAYQKNNEKIPDDTYLYIRTEFDIPSGWGEEIKNQMRQNDWQRSYIPDPTLLVER